MTKMSDAIAGTRRVTEYVEQTVVLLRTQGPRANAYGVVTDVKGSMEVLNSAIAQLQEAVRVLRQTEWPTAAEQKTAGAGKQVKRQR